jgi:dTDP-4-amino-4,6-dideoxygalactose transaminase
LGSVPQTSPGEAVVERRAEYDAAISNVLDSGHYILGEAVDAFERAFARFLGVRHCVGVASGTDALELALRAVGVQQGDAVFTVSMTAVATVMAILRIGAVPILVDVDEQRYTLDPERLEHALKRLPRGLRAKAVVPVHLYGTVADMTSIRALADEAGLKVVEDCAQAHGAELEGRAAGTLGDAAAFSFYPTKNLAALGDGGAVVTDDADTAEYVRRLRQYGWQERYVSHEVGVNSRLDEIQAAVLSVGLQHLRTDNDRRRSLAAEYSRRLGRASVVLPMEPPDVRHVFHQYVIRLSDREAVRDHCTTAGIGTAIHYPLPVHAQPAFRDGLAMVGPMPVTDRLATEILSLPMFPQLNVQRVARVVDAITSGLAT